MSGQEITDETLVAYLDGALPADAHADVEAALASDAGLAERLAGLGVDVGALKAGFDGLLAEAPTVALPPVTANSNWRPWQAAAAAALFVIGMAAGWGLSGDATPDWHQAVADYQVLYTTETLSATPLDAEARAAGLARVNERLGLTLDADALALDGMAFQRAQMLSHQGAPLAQIAFLDDNGAPIAFCIMKAEERAAREAIEIAGLSASTWAGGGFTYILIGPADASRLDAAAEILQSRMPG
ncbi:MAG: hypothetical protein AAGH68_05640 [Pseudomonadota bacterium]